MCKNLILTLVSRGIDQVYGWCTIPQSSPESQLRRLLDADSGAVEPKLLGEVSDSLVLLDRWFNVVAVLTWIHFCSCLPQTHRRVRGKPAGSAAGRRRRCSCSVQEVLLGVPPFVPRKYQIKDAAVIGVNAVTHFLIVLFQSEANGIYNRLDPSTQKNLRDDPARTTSESARKLRPSAEAAFKPSDGIIGASSQRFTSGRNVKGVRLVLPDQSSVTGTNGQPVASSSAQRILQSSGTDGQRGKLPASANGPRRVLGSTGSFSFDDPMDGRSSVRMLSQGPKRIERDSRVKSSEDGSGSSGKRTGLAVGPLRVLSTPKASTAANETAVTAGSDGLKAQRVQVPDLKPEQPEADSNRQGVRAKRPPVGSVTSTISSGPNDRSSPRNQRTNSEPDAANSSSVKSVSAGASVARHSSKQQDRVEEALRSLDHSAWAVRMDAIETIGKSLRLQLRTLDLDANGVAEDAKVDDRIIAAFVKHMNDTHYRVSQTTLNYLMPLLKLSIRQTHQLLPHLRTILSLLFQRVIESKESTRSAAKENLSLLAASMDASALVGIVVAFLGDGSNVKVKVAVCKYLQTLLPSAGAYMRQSNNHMRSFLLKVAQLLDGEAPVSLVSACGDLIAVAVQEFGAEMESVMPVLPPTKRSILGKLLKSRGINLSLVSGITRPPSASGSSNALKSRDVPSDNQQVGVMVDERPSERSRKRAESPTANSSPALHLQKRLNTTDSGTSSNPWQDERLVERNPTQGGLLSTEQHHDPNIVVDIALRTLEQNNSGDRERKKALYQVSFKSMYRSSANSTNSVVRHYRFCARPRRRPTSSGTLTLSDC